MSENGRKTVRMDMLHGPLLKKILIFALPLALSSILQQLFNSADVAVVGWFVDSNAQAAVNSNGAFINLMINLFTGISVGVTVTIAEYIGRGRTDDIHSIIFTAMVIAVISGVFLLLLGIAIAGSILMLMQTPENVIELATLYLRIYFIGMPFVMVYNFGAAILRSVGDTRKALYSLIISGVLNVGLNMLFVAGCGMSVAGVAIATVIADAVSALLVFIFIMFGDPMLRIRFGKSKIKKEYLVKIFRIGVPAGIQGMVFSLSNVCIQTAVNGFGDKAMAGSGDAVYFEYYVYFFVNAFAQATVTFMGQNYAAGLYDRCRKIFLLSMTSALIISTVLSLTFTFGGRFFIRIYTGDPEVIEFALTRMRYVLMLAMLPSTYEVGGSALRAIGHSMLPAALTVIGSCLLRIIWVFTVFALYPDNFILLMIIYPITWAVTGSAVLLSYFIISHKTFRKKSTDTSENTAE